VLLAAQGTGVTVIGVQPSANAALTAALSGTTFVDRATAADGLAGDLEPGSVTLEIARAAGVRMVVVSEDAIARGVVSAQRELGLALEASAAVGLAAVSEGLVDAHQTTAALLTGRNVSPSVLSDLLQRGSQTL
jgi:threonine dehydratase